MSVAKVLVAGAAVRFLVPAILPAISDSLASSVEFSTPIDLFRLLKEAFFLLDSGLDVYDGGVVHHSPILVAVLKMIRDAFPPQFHHLVFSLVFTAVDLGVAAKIVALSRWYNDKEGKRAGKTFAGFSDSLVAAFYLFNPLVILTCWAKSSTLFTNFLFVELLVQVVVDNNVYRAAIAIAVAAYLSFSPIYLLIPVLGLAFSVGDVSTRAIQAFQAAMIFIVSLALLLLLSFALSPLVDFLTQCYWPILLFSRISPNMGLWWYLFTEMFEFFTPLYRCIFNLYNFIFVVPLTLRFLEYDTQGDSLMAAVLCYMWITFTKPYPVVGDLGFALSLLPIFKSTVLPQTKFLLITAITMTTVLLLAPIFYYCWIVLGNGNSNFFYSMSLGWGAVYILLFLDLLWGRLVYDYILANKVDGKVRLTQI